jgi:hypothetical protein
VKTPRQPEIRIRSGAGAKKSKVLLRVWNGCGVRYIEADRKNSTQ